MGLTAHANYSAAAQALSVRPLPQRCNHLQPLRPCVGADTNMTQAADFQ